jgi:hypothetical protein
MTKYQVEMAAKELKTSTEEMQAQITGFQEMIKTTLDKLSGLESWALFRCTLKVEIFLLSLHHINLWIHA